MPRKATKAKPAQTKAKAKPVSHVNGNGIAPTVFTATPLDEIAEDRPPSHDENGRFVTGNNLGRGRPPGSKNKLTEDFITDFHECWKAHGPEALKTMATEEPGAFVRAAVQLMPKDVLLDARGAGLIVVRLDDIDMSL